MGHPSLEPKLATLSGRLQIPPGKCCCLNTGGNMTELQQWYFFRIAFLLLLACCGCSLLGKSGKISITNPGSIPDLCVKINSTDKSEAKSLPYTYNASEGETVAITAFTSTGTIATGSVTTRITNDCESEVSYSAKIYDGSISVTDDYVAVASCTKENSTANDSDQ
jgi:hypothetical protein